MKSIRFIYLFIVVLAFSGCETVNEAGRTTGKVVGEVMNIPGSVTEGGAEAIQGSIKDEENPYGR